MYARLVAIVCLLNTGAVAGGFRTGDGKAVELYLKSYRDASPGVVKDLKAQLIAVLRSAGLQIGWWSARDRLTGVDGDLITIDLQGTCDPWAAPNRGMPSAPVALASTAVSDGRVLPFSQVDCTAVNRFLSVSLEALPASQRERVYSRALARLLAHEVYHVMTQSTAHRTSGIAKATVTPADLIGEHFDFGGLRISEPRLPEQTAPALEEVTGTE